MIFGWRPKLTHGAPIPLKFSSEMMDEIVSFLCSNESLESPRSSSPSLYNQVVYQGFRPSNTFQMHKKFTSEDTYSFRFSSILASKNFKFSKYFNDVESVNTKRPFLGMRPGVPDDCLIFDSIFEGGNLDTVIRTGPDEYELYIRVDTNTKGHTSW